MGTQRATRACLLIAIGGLGAGNGSEWTSADLDRIVGELAAAGRAGSVQDKDAALALVAGRAYGLSPSPGSDVPRFSKRVLSVRAPSHPPVKPGQELLAVMRQLYQDLARRAEGLARLERSRKRRARLETQAAEARAAAEVLERELQVELTGMRGFLGLPPQVSSGDDPKPIGARAEVVGQKLIVERLPRATFAGDQAPTNEPRTSQGALREVRAALKQFDTTASMLGRYDKGWRQRKGRVHFVAPAGVPAVYLRELAIAAREAGFSVVNVVVLDSGGNVAALPVRVKAKKSKKLIPVDCPGREDMKACVKRILHARARGTPVFAR